MDLVATLIDLLSIAVLVFIVSVGFRTLRAFGQSKRAVRESASLLSVIVNGLTSRVEESESLVDDFRTEFDAISQRSAELEGEHLSLHSSYVHVLRYLQEILSNDKRLILELEQLKTRLTSIQQRQARVSNVPGHPEASPQPMAGRNVLAALTPTERQTLEILSREGAKAAPELGRRMRKSREHTARLMKKLYLEGYVDRESNHPPFRYKLNEKIASLLEPREKSVTAQPSEKA